MAAFNFFLHFGDLPTGEKHKCAPHQGGGWCGIASPPFTHKVLAPFCCTASHEIISADKHLDPAIVIQKGAAGGERWGVKDGPPPPAARAARGHGTARAQILQICLSFGGRKIPAPLSAIAQVFSLLDNIAFPFHCTCTKQNLQLQVIFFH